MPPKQNIVRPCLKKDLKQFNHPLMREWLNNVSIKEGSTGKRKTLVI
jgi:hypothetical protein